MWRRIITGNTEPLTSTIAFAISLHIIQCQKRTSWYTQLIYQLSDVIELMSPALGKRSWQKAYKSINVTRHSENSIRNMMITINFGHGRHNVWAPELFQRKSKNWIPYFHEKSMIFWRLDGKQLKHEQILRSLVSHCALYQTNRKPNRIHRDIRS